METTHEQLKAGGRCAPASGSPVVALSIRQPWAWLILHGGKDIENRNWPTRFRGRIYLHADKARGTSPLDDYYDRETTKALSL